MARRIEAPCIVEIEQTAESLHAHAILDGIDIRPGDTVLVHGAPRHVRFGDRLRIECSATIVHAGAIGRAWAQFMGLLELMELFEVGFQPKESA